MTTLLDTFHLLPPARDSFQILLDAGLKSVAVLALAGLALAGMRRRSAAARYMVCFLAVASLLALPVLSWTLPGWRVLPVWLDFRTPSISSTQSAKSIPSTIPPAPRRFPTTAPAAPEMAPPAPLPSAPVQIVAAPQLPRPRATLDGARAGLLAWLAGVLLALAPVVLGVFSLHRLERAARRETAASWLDLLAQLLTRLGFRRPVVLLKAAHRRMPMTWGVLRPKVLLPEESRDWPEERRGVVLLHELAHAQRCDYLTHLVARLVCALYWFNPLVWMAARRLAAERERACDDIVLRHGAQPADYAGQLLEISAGLSPGWLAGRGGIAMARPSSLESRLRAILDSRRNRAAVTRWTVVSAWLLLTAILVPLAMLKAAPSPQSTNPQSAIRNPQSDWGEAMEGVSVRLSAEGAVWDFRQQGFFKFSVRNQGRQAVAVWRTEAEGELEMDGIWYRWSQPVDAKTSVLPPGGQFDGLALSIGGGEWRKDANFLPTVAGKHRLRFAVPAQLESGGALMRVVSNPLDVEFRWSAGATNLPATYIPGDLPVMARIEGRVVDDETGAAVANFTPQMGVVNPEKPDEITWSLNLSGRMAGGQGRFRLEGQKTGQVWRILADGYLPQMVLEHPLAGTMQTASLVVRLHRGGELRGLVVNDTGQPVAGARVAVHRAQGSSVYDVFPDMRGIGDTSVATDAAGRFALRGVDGTAQQFVVTSADGQMVQTALQSAPGQEMKIILPKPAVLIVRYDIPGDTDEAKLRLSGGQGANLSPEVANRGQIVLTNLAPGAYEFSRERTLQAGVWREWPCDRRTVVLEPGQTQLVNLVRSTGQRVRGEVTGLDKTKAANGCLFVRAANQETNAMSWMGQFFDAQTFGKDGLFQTALLEPGAYAVMAEVYEPEVYTGIFYTAERLPDCVGLAIVTVSANAPPPPLKIELRPRVDPAKAP